MRSEKPNFLSQPVVKNVFMFRNGDPYYEARRIVINQKRISNFETLLREVTGGIQAPFGAVRNIYTPTGGHRVRCLESLRSGEQYVAAGRERFKRLDYHQIGSRRKRMMQALPMQAKPPPQNRIIVSARFLKPIREPCPIFVVANGDVLDPATRLLIHHKMLSQFDRILEMVTEKMGLKVMGGVRSLYTYGGHQVTDGNQLESGQLYVAVGRERFKKLPYSDLLFTKPRGTRRYNGMKAHSLPPIYRFSKQNGNNKSVVRSSDSGDGDSKNSLPRHIGSNKEHLSSIVREISQARLISLRKKRSGQSMTFSISDNADLESKADDGITEDKIPQDQPAEEKTAADDPKAEEGSSENAVEEEEEAAIKNTTDDDSAATKEEKHEEDVNENDENKCEKDGEATAGSGEKGEEVEEVKEATAESGENEEEVEEEVKEATAGSGEEEEEVEEEVKEEFKKEEHGSREGEVEEEVKEEVTDESKEGHMDGEQGSREKEEELKEELRREVMNESKEEVKKHEQGSRSRNSDKTQDSKDKEDGNHPSSEREKDELDKTTEEEKEDKGSGKGQKTSVNDKGEAQKQKVMENSNDQGKTQSDNETSENDSRSSSSGNSNQEEDVSTTKEGHTKEAGEEEEGKIN